MKLNVYSWLNNFFWIALFIGVIFHAITFGYTASWILVFILFGLYVFNALTLLFPLFYLDIIKQDNIIIDPEHTYNHHITIKHRYNRRVYLPYLSLTIFFDSPKMKSTAKVFSFSSSRVQIPVSFSARSRGVIERPNIRIRATDFFNIFHKTMDKRLLSTIYVLPKTEEEATNLLITKHLAFMMKTNKFDIQKSFEFSKLKEYSVGDNTKFIDWKTTSKTQTLTIKEFEYEKKKETYFIFCGNEGKDYEYLLSVFYTLVMNLLSTSLFGVINRREYNGTVKQVDFASLTADNRNEQVLLKLHDYVSQDSNKVIFLPSLNESLLMELQNKNMDNMVLITLNSTKGFTIYRNIGGVYEKS